MAFPPLGEPTLARAHSSRRDGDIIAGRALAALALPSSRLRRALSQGRAKRGVSSMQRYGLRMGAICAVVVFGASARRRAGAATRRPLRTDHHGLPAGGIRARQCESRQRHRRRLHSADHAGQAAAASCDETAATGRPGTGRRVQCRQSEFRAATRAAARAVPPGSPGSPAQAPDPSAPPAQPVAPGAPPSPN